jgi:hypothetical protein
MSIFHIINFKKKKKSWTQDVNCMLNCRRFCVIIHVITLTIIKITISYKYDDDDDDDDDDNNKRFDFLVIIESGCQIITEHILVKIKYMSYSIS